MLNYEFPPLGGGAANANRYLLDEYAGRDDLEVDLVTSSSDGYREESFAENVTLYRLDVHKDEIHYWTQTEIVRYSWKGYRKAHELMAESDYDLVHAWFGVPSGVVARMLGLPYIVALRGSDVPGYNERFSWQYVVLKPLVRKVWRDAEAVVANSAGLRQLARVTADIPIEVIPNGVAVDEFNPVYHDRDRLQVLCVSRLIERKGIRFLVEAVAELDVELTVVGEGGREAVLKSRARQLGIEDKVTFIGYVPHDEIHSYYEHADVFVLPSFNEGMSNTVLEAMAAGLPIVTTDTGGTAELIEDNGYVVPAGHAESIAEVLSEYSRNHDKIRRHGQNSRAIAETMSWTQVAEQYRDAYESVSVPTRTPPNERVKREL
ncbi:glycosyltransferase family 4 protein [Halosolutus halophilus]|uniref:glycosyltransferase family 4 protein n=1 Tax=Halosolutus halophilus TaxID=1552990 RepID=UPI002234EDE6|nr:glycosyltransferase family 4 protein [Halosolutus halophilus]